MAERIAVIGGDGVGPEVVEGAIVVLDAALEATGRQERLEFDRLPWGSAYYLEHGRMMPADALERLAEYDAIVLGAIGSRDVPDHVTVWGLILPIRQSFQQFVNLRPAKLLPGLVSPLRDVTPDDIDIVCVRENSEGEYSGVGGRMQSGPDNEIAVQSSVFTRQGIERICEYAFALAESRPRRLVASATKSNSWAHAMTLWDEVCASVAERHPDVTVVKYHVDALVTRFVIAPESIDVVVCSNLFGDILSDLAAGLLGSLGVAGSANIDPTRRYPSMFEPVHGSAPDIAGTGMANPYGAIWSGAMMLEHLGLAEEARLVMGGLECASLEPETRTPDVRGVGTTRSVSEAIAAHVRSAR
jgi:tartrate dehydrogenase/decarboxylase/D-malate dehydrogenase